MQTQLETRPTNVAESDTKPDVVMFDSYSELCGSVAEQIASLIRCKPNAVLGLATGSTPEGVYQILAQMHSEGLDFSNVYCFNLDEYYPMRPSSSHSYHRFMSERLFNKINCRHWSIPDGKPRSTQQIVEDCAAYEAKIAEAGGVDLQILGIGRNGHIGFNEPGSAIDSRTRLVELDPMTREDAVSSFVRIDEVPEFAISMGIGTILQARSIVLLAKGTSKAQIVYNALTGPISSANPASFLRTHSDVSIYIDKSAAALLG